MAALLSSPLAATAHHQAVVGSSSRYDPFDQPNSPSFKHTDLPAEFGDQSFGSSMSLGSSFELNRMASGFAENNGHHQQQPQSQRVRQAFHPNSSSPSSSSSSNVPQGQHVRRSPPRNAQEGLGAAMGTTLNSKSPGLAAKLNSSPHYMDMSPMPPVAHSASASSFQETPLKRVGRSSLLNVKPEQEGDQEENLPPGSAMKEDTSFGSHPSAVAKGDNTFPRFRNDVVSNAAQGGSLGRLFGTELSMHGSKNFAKSSSTSTAAGTRASVGCVFGGHGLAIGGDDEESFSSPDKEPPAKRRPASLPISHNPQQRPSLRSAGMGPPFNGTGGAGAPGSTSSATSRPRPNLLKSMTTPAEECMPSSIGKRTSLDHLRQQYRTSDSVIPTLGRQARARTGSMERMGAIANGPSSSQGGEQRVLQKSSLPPPMHPTIIESPSPSKAGDELAGYFFDPQSPEMQRSSQASQANSHASTSSSRQHPSIQSVFLQPQASLRPRTLEKAASSAVVPSMAGSLLGKRANPYAKRTAAAASPAADGAALHSKATNHSGSSTGRLKVPAPRRCQSALDNSAAFQLAGAALGGEPSTYEDMSLSSADGSFRMGNPDHAADDASPSLLRTLADRRTKQGDAHAIRLPPGFDASGSPIASGARSSSRPHLFRRPSKDDSSPLGYGKRFSAQTGAHMDADNVGSSPRAAPHPSAATIGAGSLLTTMPRSPSDHSIPGFGASEREGKILPCFNVKDDGLMRITAETLVDLIDGKFNEQADDFQIIDCRFGYEYDGGHIRGAINLSTMDKVKRHFLQPTDASRLPCRSQSGKPDKDGKLRKRVVVFHCEFSAKRAPSSALALRQADRALAHDYPNCHYPEVYVLQGGYCNFYKQFAKACQPQAYVQMDDPKFQQRRSIELNGFRKQFSRHRSFAYGDSARQSHSDGSLAPPPAHRFNGGNAMAAGGGGGGRTMSTLARTIKEEDCSFDNSTSSPSTMQAEATAARRRGLIRHATATSALGSAPAHAAVVSEAMQSRTAATAKRTALFDHVRPVLKPLDDGAAPPTCVGDLSFGSCCSIGDDSVGANDTFDASTSGALGESPCAAAAAAASQPKQRTIPSLVPGPAKRIY